jgi:LmbE family N-acetylglucosaminyl deacetylase
MSDLLLRHVGTPPAAQRVLVIGAHPDDPEFFCAGTIARWIAAGTIVHYVVVTSGDKGIPEDWTDPRPFRHGSREGTARCRRGTRCARCDVLASP